MTDRDFVGMARDYAKSVVRGRTPAAKAVKRACQRHLDGLGAQRRKDYPYKLDKAKAGKVCRFVELLPHVKGKWAREHQKITLEPWQAFILVNVFGWVRKRDNLRRYRRVYIEVPRKNAKSTTTAGVADYMLLEDGEHGAEVYSGATTEKQAWEVFGPARLMVKNTPELQEHYGVEVGAKNLHVIKTASKFEPIIGKPGDGASPSFAVTDEYHEHATSEQFDTMLTGMGAREQPIAWAITTAGSDTAGPCYALRQEALDTLEGKVASDDLFAMVYTLDEGRTEHFQSLLAVRQLDILCSCHSVSTIQIARQAHEACVTLATSVGIDPTEKIGALTTLIERLQREASAAVAMTGFSAKRTRAIASGNIELRRNGLNGTEIERERPTSVGARDWGDEESSIASDLRSTASAARNTSRSTRSSEAGARSAQSHEKLHASITTTVQALFAGSSVHNATPQSVYSEILRKVYSAHSPTCEVRKQASVSDDGSLLVKIPGDDWSSPEALRKANPNLGVSVSEEFLREAQKRAVAIPREQATFKTKHLNVWVTAASPYFNAESWARNADPTLTREVFRGRTCYAALDLASSQDVAGYVLLFPEDRDGVTHYTVFSRFYLPENEAEKPERKHYAGWVTQGHITATPDDITDYDYIEADIKADGIAHHIAEIAFDQWDASQTVTHLQNYFGIEKVVQFPMTVQHLSQPMKLLAGLIDAGRIHHNGDPVLAWMIGNVTAQVDRNDNVFPRKERPDRKIDGAVMLTMALGRATTAVPEEDSVYETRGVVAA